MPTKESLEEKQRYIEEQIILYEQQKIEIAREIYKKKYIDNLEYPKLNLVEKTNKLESLARVLAKVWYYGDFKAETPNERVLQMLMEDLGLWEFVREDDMIASTEVDENLYKQARERIEKPKMSTLKVEWIKWKDKAACEGAFYVSMDSFIDHMAEEYDLTRK